MGKLVFISYSHVQAILVSRLRQDLQQHGISAWVDHESLQPGTPNWGKAIEQGVKSCQAFIYIASPEAKDSEYVIHEYDYARFFQVPVYPLWIAGVNWLDVALFGMSRMQYIDARSNYIAAFKQLLHLLGATQESNSTSSEKAGTANAQSHAGSVEQKRVGLIPEQQEQMRQQINMGAQLNQMALRWYILKVGGMREADGIREEIDKINGTPIDNARFQQGINQLLEMIARDVKSGLKSPAQSSLMQIAQEVAREERFNLTATQRAELVQKVVDAFTKFMESS